MNEKLWEQFDLTEMNNLVRNLLHENNTNFTELVMQLMEGDFKGAGSCLKSALTNTLMPGIAESKGIILSILLIGILAMLLYYVSGLVKNKQVADLAYYFVYLFLSLILLKSFGQLVQTGGDTIQTCREFIAVLMPSYCLSISIAGGSVSALVNYEFTLLTLSGTDLLLAKILIPLTQSYVFLAIMNGLDDRHRFKEFMKLIDKIISWGIKICLTVALSLGSVQNLIASQIDGVQKTVVQKTISAIPGIGDFSDSVTQVLLNSAGLIRNSMGVAAMLFLFLVVLAPIWRIFCISLAMKFAAACIGLMGQNRLSDTISKVGDAGIQIMKINMCGVLIFYIAIAMTMLITKGGPV